VIEEPIGLGRRARTLLVVGSRKMHGTRASAAGLLSQLAHGLRNVEADTAVCVPLPRLDCVGRLVQGTALKLGAQDVSERAQRRRVDGRSFRSHVVRCWVPVRHRRAPRHRETDVEVASTAKIALAHGLTPIFCVGESLAQRDLGQTRQTVLRQIDALVSQIGAQDVGRVVVAYEPVWAIGTGRTATPAQAQDVHAAIRERLARTDSDAAAHTRILYGGSVKPNSAKSLFAEPDIDGALVGGASMVTDDFVAISAAAAAATLT
jgi:triosephosphate isomerase (TIM)